MAVDWDLVIREEWFKDHVATYTNHGDLKILEWKKPGTIIYMVRYVFDGNKMYVSGDLGEAVFCFTEKADLGRQSKYDLHYFEGKLMAFSDDRRDFDSDQAVKRLREWLKDLKESSTNYDNYLMRLLFSDVRSCGSVSEWHHHVDNYSQLISKLDHNYWEWMYDIGNVIPTRIRSYLIGLEMAAEQYMATAIQAAKASLAQPNEC